MAIGPLHLYHVMNHLQQSGSLKTPFSDRPSLNTPATVDASPHGAGRPALSAGATASGIYSRPRPNTLPAGIYAVV